MTPLRRGHGKCLSGPELRPDTTLALSHSAGGWLTHCGPFTNGDMQMIPLQEPAPRRPDQILKEDFLPRVPRATQDLHARRMRMSRTRLNEILNGRREVSADTALRLGRYFGTRPEFWLEAQARFDLHRARQDRTLMREIESIPPAVPARGPRGIEALAAGPGPVRGEPALGAGSLEALSATVARQAEKLREMEYLKEFLHRKGLLREAERFVAVQQHLRADGAPEEEALPDVLPLLRRRK